MFPAQLNSSGSRRRGTAKRLPSINRGSVGIGMTLCSSNILHHITMKNGHSECVNQHTSTVNDHFPVAMLHYPRVSHFQHVFIGRFWEYMETANIRTSYFNNHNLFFVNYFLRRYNRPPVTGAPCYQTTVQYRVHIFMILGHDGT